MKKGAKYCDAVKEIVKVLAKYEATVGDVKVIVEALDGEMQVQPIQESND